MQDRYLIVGETKRKGYILEEHDSFESAMGRTEYFEDLMTLKCRQKVKLIALFKPIAIYSFYEQMALYKDCVWSTSDGFDSLYVLKVPPDFRLDFFIRCRTSHQYAINFWKNSEKMSEIGNKWNIYIDAMAN